MLRPGSLRWLRFVLCVSFAVASVTRAHAQAPLPAAPQDDALGRAIAAYDAGRLVEARRWFVIAHERDPSARTLRGLGVVSYALGDYLEAAAYLEAALRHPVRPLTEELRTLVVRLLEASRTHLGRIELALEGAELWVDDARVTLDDAHGVYVAPGRHAIVVRIEGETPSESVVVLEAGSVHSVTASATPLASTPERDPEPEAEPAPVEGAEQLRAPEGAPPEPPSPSRATPAGRRHRRATLATLSVGSAGVVAGFALVLTGGLRHRKIVLDCRHEPCTDSEVSARYADGHIDALRIAGDTTLALSAAALVTTGILYLTRPRGGPSVAVGTNRVTVLGTF